LCKRPYNPAVVGDTDTTYTNVVISANTHPSSNTHNNHYDYDDDDNSDYDYDDLTYDDDFTAYYEYLERDIIDYGVVIPENNGWEDYGRSRWVYWEDAI
jgi:hypothetical protein